MISGFNPNTQPTEGIHSKGVMILSSMDKVTDSCGSGHEKTISDHQKSGYVLCHFVSDFITTDAGPVPIVKTRMDKKDVRSTLRVRAGIGRHDYQVAPGLYGVGKPDKDSEVLVTANFKLSFDHLRRELEGINAWILVLNTYGINVWCAAGKKTFSTAELVKQIKSNALEKVVNHRRVIVPQLGATGIASRAVKKNSGFSVVFGPVRAADIPAFLGNQRKADRQMRMVTFTFIERLVLTPVELHMAVKPALITAVVLFLLSGFGPGFFSVSGAWTRGTAAIAALFSGIIAGGMITPALLPVIPFRPFAAKGIIAGAVAAGLMFLAMPDAFSGSVSRISLILFTVTVSSWLAMNFTGATPFTSPSGVEKEMKRFIPVQAATLILSTGLWIYSAF